MNVMQEVTEEVINWHFCKHKYLELITEVDYLRIGDTFD